VFITVFQVQCRKPVTVLQPHGNLDGFTSRDLIAKAREVHKAGARDILLDLIDTTYITYSGLVAVYNIAVMLGGDEPSDPGTGWKALQAFYRGRDRGPQQHLKLLNPQPDVEEGLEREGFTQFLETYTDLQKAVASL
jgi:anti-anti-sigma regulatory factor